MFQSNRKFISFSKFTTGNLFDQHYFKCVDFGSKKTYFIKRTVSKSVAQFIMTPIRTRSKKNLSFLY